MVSDEAISSSLGIASGRENTRNTPALAGGARENSLAKTSFMLRIAALSDVFLTKAQTHDSMNTHFQ